MQYQIILPQIDRLIPAHIPANPAQAAVVNLQDLGGLVMMHLHLAGEIALKYCRDARKNAVHLQLPPAIRLSPE